MKKKPMPIALPKATVRTVVRWIRLPEKLDRAIEETAKRNRRTKCAEMLVAIEKAFNGDV